MNIKNSLYNEHQNMMKNDINTINGIDNRIDANRLSRDTINTYYNYGFLNFRNSITCISTPASSHFKMLVAKISSFLFSKFPEFTTTNDEVKKLLDKNKHILETFFFKVLHEYVLYGYACVDFNDNTKNLELNLIPHEFYSNGVIKETGYSLDNDNLLSSSENQITYFYIENRQYCLQSDGSYIFIRKDSLKSELCLVDNLAFINYVEDLFITLETAFFKHNNFINSIDNILILPEMYFKEMKNISKSSNSVAFVSSNGIDAAKIKYGFFDNEPMATSMNITKTALTYLKEEIINCLGLDDIFSNKNKDNISETRIGASNRINISTITWEAKQRKVNNFIKNCLLEYIRGNIPNINLDEIKLEINSLNIIQEQIQSQDKEIALQKIMELLNQANNSSPSVSIFLYSMIKDLSLKAMLTSETKELIQNMIQEQQNMKEMESKEKEEIPIEVQQIQSKIELDKSTTEKNYSDANKTQIDSQETIANINKTKAETEQIKIETELKPIEIGIAEEDQKQQSLDSVVNASKTSII